MIKNAKNKLEGVKPKNVVNVAEFIFPLFKKIYPGLDLVGDNNDIYINSLISSNNHFLFDSKFSIFVFKRLFSA